MRAIVIVNGVSLEIDYIYFEGKKSYLDGPHERCYEEEPPIVEINSALCGGQEVFDILSDNSLRKIEKAIIKHEEAQNE